MPPRRPISDQEDSPRVRFAKALVELRREKGIALRELGDTVRSDHSHLGHMERGRTLGGPELVRELDKFYGTTHLIVLWDMALRDPSQFRERYQQYMSLEAVATGMQQYSPSIIPGLLQTEAYARALLQAARPAEGDDLADQVSARLGRQQIFSRGDAPQFRAILDEAALNRPLLDVTEWHKQLGNLIEMGSRSNVTIQVVRSAAGLHGLPNTDTMFLWLPDGRTVAYVETAYSGELIEEVQAVDRLRVAYDQLRDLALSPCESRELINQFMEATPCERPAST